MHLQAQAAPAGRGVVYPESDGKPMADNTKQLRWIVTIYGNLCALFRAVADVFAGGNQFWFPVEGESELRQAPDVYVVFGRPKGDRPSYRQWEEGGVPMTVVFEILSPANDPLDLIDTHDFYDRYGVEEYYLYDPQRNALRVYLRGRETLARRWDVQGFVSPRLGIRFDLSGPELVVRYPDGRPFLSFEELEELRLKAEQQATSERQRADRAEQRAARVLYLSWRVRRGEATPEETAELDRLENEATT